MASKLATRIKNNTAMRESSERDGRESSGGLVQEAEGVAREAEGVREGVARGAVGGRRGSVSGTGEGVPSPVPEDSIAADAGSGNFIRHNVCIN